MGFTGEFPPNIKQQHSTNFYNLFQKTEEADRVPLSSYLWGQHFTTKMRQLQENYRPIFLMNTEVKNPQKNMSKLNSTTYKMNYTLKSNGVYRMYVFPNSSFEKINVIHHIKKLKKARNITISRCRRKNMWQKTKAHSWWKLSANLEERGTSSTS